MLVLTADVDVVVIGGGVARIGGPLMADVAAELSGSAEASSFMRSLRLRDRVELLPEESPAAALGAALIGASPGTAAASALVPRGDARRG